MPIYETPGCRCQVLHNADVKRWGAQRVAGLKGRVFLGTDASAEAIQQRLDQNEKHSSQEIPRLQRSA